MSDRPTPEDVIDGLECGWCTTSLYGGSIVTALHDAGYRIVSAADAAKLDRLRECEVARTADMGGSEYPVGWADGWNAALRTVRGEDGDE